MRMSTADAGRISTAQAARHYGIPERTIRRWHAEERLCDPERRGRTLWWSILELDQLAAWRRDRQREKVAG